MTQRMKHFQRELKSIASHFSLHLSQTYLLRQQAIGIDNTRRKMILLERSKHPHFRIVDLDKITSCSMKVSYKNIGPGELEDKNMDDFIEKMSLKLDHIDESKSIELSFFNSIDNASIDLTHLKRRLEKLKDELDTAIHKQIAKRA